MRYIKKSTARKSEITLMQAESSFKADQGKPDMALVTSYFGNALLEVARVCEYGKTKYGAYTWHGIEKERYISALMRHLIAYQQGQLADDDSFLHHLAHMAWNALAICELALREGH